MQIINDEDTAWAVGDGNGKYGITNQNSLNIEICVNDGNYTKEIKDTLELTKYLMQLHDVPFENVLRHYDASRKVCPNIMKDNNWAMWNKFKADLKNLTEVKEVIDVSKLYRVQVGAYSDKANAEKLLNDLKLAGFNGIIKEDNIESDIKERKSKKYTIGNAEITETTPDNIYIAVVGDTLHNAKLNGVNGVLFDTRTAPVTSPESCVFIAMNDGKAISNNSQFNGWNGPPRATLIYHTNKKLGFRQLKDINPIRDNTIWAVGGYMVKPYMDFENEQIPTSVNYETTHTYIGYDINEKVYLIVKPKHMIKDIVPLLNELGIIKALVLDGGLSSQYKYGEDELISSRAINTAILLKEL